jgi:linalool 8-monooxygenase
VHRNGKMAVTKSGPEAVLTPMQMEKLARRKSIPVSGAEIDLKSPDLYTDENFHSVFARLRTEQPVYWNPEADSSGFWAITRYEDVVRVVQNPDVFSAAIKNGGMRIINIQDTNLDPRPHLLSMDPPEHTEFRRTLQPLFAPQRVAAMASVIRARMTRLIDGIAEAGQAEFVSSIAAPLTLGLLTDLLNVCEADSARLLRWSNAIIGDDDEDYQASPQYRYECIAEMDEYALQLLAERKGAEGDDFVSYLARVEIEGRPLERETYTQNFGAFLVAGNETTRHALSAGVLALSAFPAEKQKLISDRSLVPSAVKEIIRWATPLMHVRRTAMRDIEIGGKVIKKGDKVVVWYNSANRDDNIWNEATKFDVGRFTNPAIRGHLGFGQGPHHCLGWRLAELQLRIALEELLARLPDLQATSAVTRLRSNFIGGIKQLPVVYTPVRPGSSISQYSSLEPDL